jgi:membrane protease YdiL (CAAX protease family)
MADSLEHRYASGGFGRALEPGSRPALVVVDFVMAYLQPGSPLYAGVEAARDACAVLLRAARQAGVPILHTNVRYQAGGRDGGVFFRKLPALACFAFTAIVLAPLFEEALFRGVLLPVVGSRWGGGAAVLISAELLWPRSLGLAVLALPR